MQCGAHIDPLVKACAKMLPTGVVQLCGHDLGAFDMSFHQRVIAAQDLVQKVYDVVG